jgi:hypothetical protein
VALLISENEAPGDSGTPAADSRCAPPVAQTLPPFDDTAAIAKAGAIMPIAARNKLLSSCPSPYNLDYIYNPTAILH